MLETKKGTYRTKSSYFLHEIEELLEQSDLNEKFDWLFKEKSNLEIEHQDKILEQCSYSWIFMRNRTAISHKMSVFPLDYIDLPD